MVINGVFKKTSAIYNTLLDTKIKQEQVEATFEKLYPTNGKSKSINTMNSRTQEILANIFANADNKQTPVNTGWNLYNTLTNYNTHHIDALKNPERSLTVGTGVRTNGKAMEAVASVLELDEALFDERLLLNSVEQSLVDDDIEAMLKDASSK